MLDDHPICGICNNKCGVPYDSNLNHEMEGPDLCRCWHCSSCLSNLYENFILDRCPTCVTRCLQLVCPTCEKSITALVHSYEGDFNQSEAESNDTESQSDSEDEELNLN
jgi:hypothetical protein